MNRRIDAKKIKVALEGGIPRAIALKAEAGQSLTYIISEKKYFHHANMISAKAEKEFLQAALGREMRIYKVWNVKRSAAESDMELLRGELAKKTNWNEFHHAIDRMLEGAGY